MNALTIYYSFGLLYAYWGIKDSLHLFKSIKPEASEGMRFFCLAFAIAFVATIWPLTIIRGLIRSMPIRLTPNQTRD